MNNYLANRKVINPTHVTAQKIKFYIRISLVNVTKISMLDKNSTVSLFYSPVKNTLQALPQDLGFFSFLAEMIKKNSEKFLCRPLTNIVSCIMRMCNVKFIGRGQSRFQNSIFSF